MGLFDPLVTVAIVTLILLKLTTKYVNDCVSVTTIEYAVELLFRVIFVQVQSDAIRLAINFKRFGNDRQPTVLMVKVLPKIV